MSKKVHVVIGAGSGGLVVAIGLARAKKKVILIEKGLFGGDCTNYGCIPSKTLIKSSQVAHFLKTAEMYGIEAGNTNFNANNAMKNVQQTVEKVRAKENAESLKSQGVETICGHAKFLDPHTLEVQTQDQKQQIKADKIILACGSVPLIPDVEGLKESNYLTNETIFELKTIPKSLVVLGGGPIGCELAQSFARLGSKVTILHKHDRLFEKGSSKVSPLIQTTFENEGITIELNAELKRVETKANAKLCTFTNSKTNEEKTIEYEHLLISVGRAPQVNGLDLEKAGVRYSEKGIFVDEYGRTNMSHILACGDVIGKPFFTHLAENRARGILFNLLLPFGIKRKLQILQPTPRVTFTDPEVASIGLSPEKAIQVFGEKKIATYFVPMSEVDRAICEKREEGFIEITTRRFSSQIIGATIVGPRSGEMLMQITTAMQNKIPLRKFSDLIHPYPIYNQGIRKAADQWLTKTILRRK